MFSCLSDKDPLLQPILWFLRSLDKASKLLVLSLFLLAALALALPPYFGFRCPCNFWTAMFNTNDAFTSVSIDIFIAAAAFLMWAIHDMHQLEFSAVSVLALVCAFGVALALPIPLYLAARTVRQAHIRAERAATCNAEAPTPLLPPERSWCCPLAALVAVSVATQAVFITNVDNIRRHES